MDSGQPAQRQQPGGSGESRRQRLVPQDSPHLDELFYISGDRGFASRGCQLGASGLVTWISSVGEGLLVCAELIAGQQWMKMICMLFIFAASFAEIACVIYAHASMSVHATTINQ
mmetsp:Transcript_37064/g.90412  ORF Transcript_37064/g.90412 Transcript_37064/m.90412 type:complete len:115 (-) Transcript_37064:331-675(-)